MTTIYYTPPSDAIFEEVKQKAIEIWSEYANEFGYDEFGYVDSKIERIKDMKNIQDNVMYIVAMFDMNNQIKMAEKLSEEARKALRERMIDGGNSEYTIPF